MRKSILIVIPALIAISTTACSKRQAAKAAAAVGAKVGQKGDNKAIYNEADKSIKGDIEKLHKQNFFGMDDKYSQISNASALRSTTPEQKGEIKKILNSIRGQSEAMIKAAKSMNDGDTAGRVSHAETLHDRATKGIESLETEEKVTSKAGDIKDAVVDGFKKLTN